MSILIGRKSLYDENKKARRSQLTSIRTKLPSSLKTRKCSKELKGEKCHAANHRVIIGQDLFHLCQKHFDQMNLRTTRYERVEFLRASEL